MSLIFGAEDKFRRLPPSAEFVRARPTELPRSAGMGLSGPASNANSGKREMGIVRGEKLNRFAIAVVPAGLPLPARLARSSDAATA